MKKRIVSNILVLVFALAILLNSVSFVNAFGFSQKYSGNDKLELDPGETKEIVFGALQNMVGDEDITLKGEILMNKDIVEIINNNQYFVPLGEKNVKVELKISIPEDAKPGEVYESQIRFKEVDHSSEKGSVGISKSLTKNFKIYIKDESELESKHLVSVGKYFLFFFLIMVVLGIIVVSYLLMRNIFLRKNNQKTI